MAGYYNCLDEMWYDALTTILAKGRALPSRDGPTYEVLGWVGRLEDPRSNFLFSPVRKVNPSYAAAEILWYLSGQRTVHALVPYAPQYTRFCNEAELWVNSVGDETNQELSPDVIHGNQVFRTNPDGTVFEPKCVLYAHGAYGYRMSRRFGGYTALANIIRMLHTDPNSRQAVLTLYDAGMDMEKASSGDKKDIPCTLALNFILREGKLNCMATMRSNDIWLGLPHDVWCFTLIQQLIAEALKVEVGWYQHSVMSLHLYDRNKDKASAAVEAGRPAFDPTLLYSPHGGPVSAVIKRSLELERANRANGTSITPETELNNTSLLKNLVLMAALKWAKDRKSVVAHISNPVMQKYMESHWC